MLQNHTDYGIFIVVLIIIITTSLQVIIELFAISRTMYTYFFFNICGSEHHAL